MKLKILGLLAVGLLAGPMAANAGTVRYEFTAFSSVPSVGPTGGSVRGGFVVETSGFISSLTAFAPASLLSCEAFEMPGDTLIDCAQMTFSPDVDGTGYADRVHFGISGWPNSGSEVYYYFVLGAFSAAGVYDTVFFGDDQKGRLVVTDLGHPVPEPGTLALLGLGLLGLGATRRKAA